MELKQQQVDDLKALCQWLLEYDADLPNGDGQRTADVVRSAQRLSRLIDKPTD